MTMFSAVTLVLWLGARSVLHGTMTGGELAQVPELRDLHGHVGGGAVGDVGRAAARRRRHGTHRRAAAIAAVDLHAARIPSRSTCRAGQIRFEHLIFNYPSRPDTRALDDFHLEIAPGETVAFVGPSGAGKSTAFQLLLRFYDPSSGRILIDGVDIARRGPVRGARAASASCRRKP